MIEERSSLSCVCKADRKATAHFSIWGSVFVATAASTISRRPASALVRATQSVPRSPARTAAMAVTCFRVGTPAVGLAPPAFWLPVSATRPRAAFTDLRSCSGTRVVICRPRVERSRTPPPPPPSSNPDKDEWSSWMASLNGATVAIL